MTETLGTPYLRQKKPVFEQKAVSTIGAVVGLCHRRREFLSIPSSVAATAQVGRVSPRPPDRGQSCILLCREPLLEVIGVDLTGGRFAGDPAVSERRALPARPPDRDRRQQLWLAVFLLR